ncbi:MAG: hypothetical protein CXZ00_15715 [Acidobacteria bacterium]|nr:MAG: hypothetical protein CXZ00_15715 [Acidobacteriota bacterium]
MGNTWYQRIPEHDRKVVDGIAKWLRPIPWQLFCTFEFSGEVSDHYADDRFRTFIDMLERKIKARICFLLGAEKRSRSAGAVSCAPRHFHTLMTSSVRLEVADVREAWWSVAGKGETALVEPYSKDERGIEYCMKMVNDTEGDWLFRWLEMFLPGMPGPQRPRGKDDRRRRRFKQEKESAVCREPSS